MGCHRQVIGRWTGLAQCSCRAQRALQFRTPCSNAWTATQLISGYNRNATVQDSDFSYIGGNGIASWGYTNETENSGFPYYTPNTNYPQAGVDGTDGNHPRYTIISGNTAREIGLYEKQSSFFVQAKTAESVIQGNVFFNGPRAGINFNDGFGGG